MSSRPSRAHLKRPTWPSPKTKSSTAPVAPCPWEVPDDRDIRLHPAGRTTELWRPRALRVDQVHEPALDLLEFRHHSPAVGAPRAAALIRRQLLGDRSHDR